MKLKEETGNYSSAEFDGETRNYCYNEFKRRNYDRIAPQKLMEKL